MSNNTCLHHCQVDSLHHVPQVRDRLPSFLTLPALVSHYRGAGGGGGRQETGQGEGGRGAEHDSEGVGGVQGGAGAGGKEFQGGASSLSLAIPLYRYAISIA